MSAASETSFTIHTPEAADVFCECGPPLKTQIDTIDGLSAHASRLFADRKPKDNSVRATLRENHTELIRMVAISLWLPTKNRLYPQTSLRASPADALYIPNTPDNTMYGAELEVSRKVSTFGQVTSKVRLQSRPDHPVISLIASPEALEHYLAQMAEVLAELQHKLGQRALSV